MAFVDQVKKAMIAAAVKPLVPAGWKYSLAVQHHMAIVMTISEAPVDLLGAVLPSNTREVEAPAKPTHRDVNPYYVEHSFDGELLVVMKRIVNALNTGNHGRSDGGHYVHLQIGKWDQPFVCTAPQIERLENADMAPRMRG